MFSNYREIIVGEFSFQHISYIHIDISSVFGYLGGGI